MAAIDTAPAALPSLARQRPAVGLRSVAIGLAGVAILALLAPFNDLVLNNTAFIGGALPVGAVFCFGLLILINSPLSRYRPGSALGTGELATVFIMLLIGSAVPTRGLMQMWPAVVVGVPYHTGSAPEFRNLFALLDLPDWFWPHSEGTSTPADPVIAWFYGQTPTGTSDPASVVVRGWWPTVVGWGVFFLALAAAVVGVSTIAARQWIQNERVAFPLSTVQLALIESPSPGRWLNQTLGSGGFILGAGSVVLLRTLDVLHAYFPVYVPKVTLGYNLREIFAEPPLSYVDGWVTLQTIYPLVVAVSFFVAGRVSFSLWACVILSQVPNLIMEPMGSPMAPHRSEVNLGALLAFAAMILYSGRHYYWSTLRSLVIPTAPAAEGTARPMPAAAYAGLTGSAVAVGWLWYAGMPVWPAVLLVGGLLLIWLVMANVVAHSGLLVANTLATPHEWFARGFTNPGGLASLNAAHVKTQFFAQAIGGLWAYNSDHLSVYTTHAAKIADAAAPRSWSRLWVAIVLALVIGFVAPLTSTLWCEYRYGITADRTQTMPLNAEVINGQPRWAMDHTLKTMWSGLETGPSRGSAWPWVGGSAALTGAAASLQLRYSAWPLHPIGLLMMFSFPMRRIWFSIFLGWMIKTLVVKYAGGTGLRRAEPLFIGVILGDVIATAALAILAMLLWAAGLEYRVISILPTSQY